MAEVADHNRIINAAAKKILAPLGCKRKGTSRLWYDDHGWWITVIEFQPSSWDKGSFLNVGAMWLWNAKANWSFDDGSRIEAFHQFKNAGQFSIAAEQLALNALEQVLSYRDKFSSLQAVAQYLVGKKDKSIWGYYHAAIALGLSGEIERAIGESCTVLNQKIHAPWVGDLQIKTQALLTQIHSDESFNIAVCDEIAKARELLKLPPFFPCKINL